MVRYNLKQKYYCKDHPKISRTMVLLCAYIIFLNLYHLGTYITSATPISTGKEDLHSIITTIMHRGKKGGGGGRGAEAPPTSNQGGGLSPLICTQDYVHNNTLGCI